MIQTLQSSEKSFSLKARGNSMAPNVTEGMELLIQPTNQVKAINLQDIIAFYRDDKIICHRLLIKFKLGDTKYYIEKGDNNFFPWIIREEDLLGKVIKINGCSKIPLPGKNLSKGKIFSRIFYLFSQKFMGK